MGNDNNPLANLAKYKNAALSCVHCGQCRAVIWPSKNYYNVCPVNGTNVTAGFEPAFARGKNVIIQGLLWGDLPLSPDLSDIFFQCTLCGACLDFCQNAHNDSIDFANHRWMDQVNVFEALRADLVEAGFCLAPHSEMNTQISERGNPYGQDPAEKAQWIARLDFPLKDASAEPADVLYFAGCTAALMPAFGVQNIAVATATSLHKLGVDFAVLGAKEICCGSAALRTGNKAIFSQVADQNAQSLESLGIRTIVTSCAGCYRTLKKDYEQRLGDIKIFHTIEFLANFLREHEIVLNNSGITTTYHDACHLGRHMGMYNAPREILAQISSFVEMKTTRESAHCCGAGGGVKKAFPELSIAMARNRVQEAVETGAKILVSACPFCSRNLAEAAEAMQAGIQVRDIVELLVDAIPE